MENMKSPVWLRLESMIETLHNYRNNMEGQRIPFFKKAFVMRQRKEQEEREMRQLEMQMKGSKSNRNQSLRDS